MLSRKAAQQLSRLLTATNGVHYVRPLSASSKPSPWLLRSSLSACSCQTMTRLYSNGSGGQPQYPSGRGGRGGRGGSGGRGGGRGRGSGGGNGYGNGGDNRNTRKRQSPVQLVGKAKLAHEINRLQDIVSGMSPSTGPFQEVNESESIESLEQRLETINKLLVEIPTTDEWKNAPAQWSGESLPGAPHLGATDGGILSAPSRRRFGDDGSNEIRRQAQLGIMDRWQIPDFFNLSMVDIERHATQLLEFCEPYEQPPESHILTFITTDIITAGDPPPVAHKVTLEVNVDDIVKTEEAKQLLIQLTGSRYHARKNKLKLSSNRYPTRALNKEYLRSLLNVLIEQSHRKDLIPLLHEEKDGH